MAITINKTPENQYNPITIPTEFSVSSSNVTQTNFKYICDVYINGESTYYRMKQSPHPTNGYTVFDVGGILKSYITANPPKSATTIEFQHADKSYINYTCKFGEEYGASSAIIVYPNLTISTSSNYYGVVNASLDFDEWAGQYIDFDSVYTLASSSTKFLTNAPSTQNVYSSTRSYLYFLNPNNVFKEAKYVRIKGYDSSNTLIQDLKFNTIYDKNYRVQYVGAGYKNLELIDGTEPSFTQTVGALPFFSSGVNKYTIQLFDYVNGALTELRTYKVIEDCNVGDSYQLIFQNKLGGYDTFTFTAPADKSYTVTTRDNFKKRLGEWVTTDYLYKPYQRASTQYNTIYKDKVIIKSDWITEEESIWLHELITSPDVYMVIDGREELIPINIIDTEYQVKQFAKDQLFNLQLTIEKSFDRYRQQF